MEHISLHNSTKIIKSEKQDDINHQCDYTPLFSIITVCLNPGDSLLKTVNSVLSQDYSSFEYFGSRQNII